MLIGQVVIFTGDSMYQAKVKISNKDGHFDEVSTIWNLCCFARDWISDRVEWYSEDRTVKKIETSLEVI